MVSLVVCFNASSAINLLNEITNVHTHVGNLSIYNVVAQSIHQPRPSRDYHREYKTDPKDSEDIGATSNCILKLMQDSSLLAESLN